MEKKRALEEERAAVLTLMAGKGKDGSSTTDPTYVPGDRVTSSRCSLFRDADFGVLSVRDVRGVASTT